MKKPDKEGFDPPLVSEDFDPDEADFLMEALGKMSPDPMAEVRRLMDRRDNPTRGIVLEIHLEQIRPEGLQKPGEPAPKPAPDRLPPL